MRFVLTAVLAFLGYIPATHEMMGSAFFAQLLALHALSPSAASVAGIGIIWPAIFLAGCYGLVSLVVGAQSSTRWYASTRYPFASRDDAQALSTDVTKP